MTYFTGDFHSAPDLIGDAKAALSALALLFDDSVDMGREDKRGAAVILHCLRDMLDLAGSKAQKDREIVKYHQGAGEHLTRQIEDVRAEAYAEGRKDGAKASMDSLERLARAVGPIREQATESVELSQDGVYPHIGMPEPEADGVPARCA